MDGNVWKDLSGFVSQEAITTALNNENNLTTSTQDKELVLKQNQKDRILSHVSQYIYPSELREFAVKRLGLRETKYEMIEEDHIYAKRRNFEVGEENNQSLRNDAFFLEIRLNIELIFYRLIIPKLNKSYDISLATNTPFSPFIKVLNSWSRRLPYEPKFLISKILQWQCAGYVSKDVWNEMDKIVGPDLLPTQEEIDASPEPGLEFDSHEQVVREAYDTDDADEYEKFSSKDKIYDFVWVKIPPNIYPSKRKEFALQALGMKESKYYYMNNVFKGAEKKNKQVF